MRTHGVSVGGRESQDKTVPTEARVCDVRFEANRVQRTYDLPDDNGDRLDVLVRDGKPRHPSFPGQGDVLSIPEAMFHLRVAQDEAANDIKTWRARSMDLRPTSLKFQ